MAVNQVIVNGEELVNLRNDTVTPQTLVEGETATNREGEHIQGELDPVSHDEAYLIDDPEGDIDDSDYIPFNDVSDEEQPKKKTLFSSIVDKLRTIFVSKSWGHVELLPTTETLGIKDKEVDATAPNNGVTVNHYPSSNDIRDNNNKIIARSEAIVYPNGTITAKMYAQNYDTNGNSVGQNAINLNVDKLGAFSYNVSDPNAFRSAIKTVDQLGTDIPENADLNTYKTAGTYRVPSDGIGATISNLPLALCGKVVVFNNGNGGFEQFYFPNHSPRIFVRTWWSDAWSAWKEIGEGGGDSKIHTYEDGIAIPADSDLNDYKTAGVYTTTSDSIASTIINIPKPTTGKLIVSYSAPSHNYIQQIYIVAYNNAIYTRFYDNWNLIWKEWKQLASTDDLWNKTHYLSNVYDVNTSHRILYTDDLNNFTNAGTYQYNYDSNGLPSNCPFSTPIRSFKLIVDRFTSSDSRSEVMQRITMQNVAPANGFLDWYRVKTWNTSTWSEWEHLTGAKGINENSREGVCLYPASGNNRRGSLKWGIEDDFHLRQEFYDGSAWKGQKVLANMDDISPSTVGNSYAVATVSGSAITATISGFKLRAGVIVVIKIEGEISTACTLNISSTGAKPIKFWNNEDPTYGKPIGLGCINTMIYDGTYYRLISLDRTPHVRIQDYVADTSGNILLDWGYQSNRVQLKYALSADKLTWNRYKNSAWRGDRALAEQNDLITQLGTLIPENTNINTYVNQGIYYIDTNVHASTMTNLPSSVAGKLVVFRLTDNASYKTQLFLPYNTSTVWSRNTTNNGTNWTSWVEYATKDDTGASVAKVGKSILPIWNYTTNVRTDNGITFTFNPSTGEITVNGTATATATCVLAPAMSYYIPKGIYILTGCPSGGGSGKYFISLQYTLKNGTSSSINDSGSGNTLTLSNDAYSDSSQAFYIYVGTGQTVSNLVFKPMLRPAFTTADFEPCEDIHKGNCYVGTCTTAGATKDKVAYVDGYFVLRKGVRVAIKFSNTNTYSSTTSSPVTLNVNDTGAKNIWYNSTHSGAGNTGTGTWIYGEAGKYFYFVYDGTYWIWDGRTTDSNSTNFLRNDASSTMTTSSPTLALKASNIDASKADNGVTSTQYPAYLIQDKSGRTLTRLESIIETNGNIRSFWYIRNYNTSGEIVGTKGISMTMAKDGGVTWTINDPARFKNALGIGYCSCSTAEATLAKTATLTNYQLVHGGIIVVHFGYSVPANSTLNINGQGAKSIYYRGNAIQANMILGGDRAIFAYDNYYHLIGIDRQPNYNDVIYKSYNNTATIKNAGVQTLEEITLGAGVWMVTWREQSESSNVIAIGFGFSSTKKTASNNFGINDGYYSVFPRTGNVQSFTCSLPVRITTATKFYAQHWVGGSTALTSAYGKLECVRIG